MVVVGPANPRFQSDQYQVQVLLSGSSPAATDQEKTDACQKVNLAQGTWRPCARPAVRGIWKVQGKEQADKASIMLQLVGAVCVKDEIERQEHDASSDIAISLNLHGKRDQIMTTSLEREASRGL